MEFGKRHDTTDTTDFCQRRLVADLLWTCYGETGVMDSGLYRATTTAGIKQCIDLTANKATYCTAAVAAASMRAPVERHQQYRVDYSHVGYCCCAGRYYNVETPRHVYLKKNTSLSVKINETSLS